MKKIIFTFLSFIIAITTANAQKGIDFSRHCAAGKKLLMSLDSSAKNVIYENIFPNQPNTFFNFLPDVHNVNIQIYFRKNINVQHYRYTILVDNKPIALNKSIDIKQLKDAHAGDEEVLSSTTFGTFPIKGKIITILTYDIQKPQDVYKSVFYGKPLPKAKIKGFAKLTEIDHRFSYTSVPDPKERANLTFGKNDQELTIVKDKSDIDYLYYTSIKDKQTNKIIFESTAWQYGGYLDESNELSPYIKMDKSVFKKSGNYEIIIQPLIKWTRCFDCNFSPKDIEKYTTRYTLAITLAEENYTKKELFTYASIAALSIGLIALTIIYIIKKRNKKELDEKEKQKKHGKTPA